MDPQEQNNLIISLAKALKRDAVRFKALAKTIREHKGLLEKSDEPLQGF